MRKKMYIYIYIYIFIYMCLCVCVYIHTHCPHNVDIHIYTLSRHKKTLNHSLKHFQLFYTCTYSAVGNSPLAIESCHLWRLDAFHLPGPLHSSGERQVMEAQVEMNCCPEVAVHIHPERRSGFWNCIHTRHISFWWPWFCSKNLKNTSFSYGFEGALESWLGGGLEACLGTDGSLRILAPAYLFWWIWASTWRMSNPQPPYLDQARWSEDT